MFFWTPCQQATYPAIQQPQNLLYVLPSPQALSVVQQANPDKIPETQKIEQKLPRPPEPKAKDRKQRQRDYMRNKNMKSSIMKDFIRWVKENGYEFVRLKQTLKIDLPSKKFYGILNEKVPSEGKYINFKLMNNLCFDPENEDFSLIFRNLLSNFLKTDYKLNIVSKRKYKGALLQACQELYTKLFGEELDDQ